MTTQPQTRSTRALAMAPTVGAVVTGVAGAATLIVSRQALGLDDFAPLAVLWTLWAVLAAGLTFSLQQWAALQRVSRLGLLRTRRAALGLGAMMLAILAVGTLWREEIFGSEALIWPLAAAGLPAGTALNGVRRGQLARARRPGRLGTVIAGENLVRLAVASALAIAGAAPGWYAIALMAGFVVVFGPTPPDASGSSEGEPTGSAGASTAGAASIAGFLAHFFMFGSPVALALSGGRDAEVSALFLVLTGVRVPFLILQALVPQLAILFRRAATDPTGGDELRTRIALTTVVGAGLAALAGWVAGDWVIGSIFDIRGEVESSAYALLAAASVMAVAALVSTVLLVAEDRTRRILIAWTVPGTLAVLVALTGALSTTDALAVWLLVLHATVVALALAPRRGLRSDQTPAPHAASSI